jgi:putative peptide zinc metalloprotease protein
LKLKARSDLVIREQTTPRGKSCIVKDPIARRYWQLNEIETFLLAALHRDASINDLCDGIAKQFAPRRLDPTELTVFLAKLHREGLIIGDRPDESDAIFERQRIGRQQNLLAWPGRLLCWRLPGLDLDAWLTKIVPRIEWVFGLRFGVLFLAMVVSSILLVLTQSSVLDRELAAIAGALSVDQAVLLVAIVGASKLLHELGHAFACKHKGGECRRIGVMLMVGVPTLYCDVSDSWLLPNKAHRILISAAGILVEISLAAASAWVWWLSAPGLVHTAALTVLLVCSLNTLLLNGNPLLQYDGYYVLADLIDTPNLREQSRAALGRLIAALLGVQVKPATDSSVHVGWLVIYAVASFCYRAVVIVALAWMIGHSLKPFGASFVGWAIGIMLVFSLMFDPVVRAVRFLRTPAWTDLIWWKRAIPVAVLVMLVGSAIVFTPLPTYVVAPAVLEPRRAQFAYVEVPGRLVWVIEPGAHVGEGDELARLENLPLATEVAKLRGDQQVRQRRLTSLRRRQSDPEAAAEIPAAQKALADVTQRLAKRESDLARLSIRAARAGVVMPPPPNSGDFQPQAGTPLDRANRGCYLKSGDMICVVGDPKEMDALVFVLEGNAGLVKRGDRATLFIDSQPNQITAGNVVVAASTRAETAPAELVITRELIAERDRLGNLRLQRPTFIARVELEHSGTLRIAGAIGRAKIAVCNQSLANQMWRSFWQTFTRS